MPRRRLSPEDAALVKKFKAKLIAAKLRGADRVQCHPDERERMYDLSGRASNFSARAMLVVNAFNAIRTIEEEYEAPPLA